MALAACASVLGLAATTAAIPMALGPYAAGRTDGADAGCWEVAQDPEMPSTCAHRLGALRRGPVELKL